MGMEVELMSIIFLLVALLIGLLSAIIPLAILIWLVISVQAIRKSVSGIEQSLLEISKQAKG